MLRFLRTSYESLRMTLHSIRSYRLRTFLTMLGITIGIFAITIIFTLVNTMESAVAGNLEKIGNTVLFVHNWPWAQDNSDSWFYYIGRPKVDYNDYRWLRDNLDNVDAVYYEISTGGQTLKAGKNSMPGMQVTGVTYGLLDVRLRNFQDGRYFSRFEIEAGRNVCLIGPTVAENLFPDSSPLGKQITVRGRRLTVIGVFEKEGKNPLGDDPDSDFIVPYTVMQRMFNMNSRRIDKVIAVKASSYEQLPAVEAQVEGVMRQARGLKPLERNNFSINKQESLMESISSITGYLRTGGALISVLALIVGGIGIANIMFVSVKERTREIGIQKALGARKSFILSQFLMEAIILCLFGGLMGIALTGVIAAIAQTIADSIEVAVTVTVLAGDVILGIIISVSLGLVFGFLPAYFASNLDPVEAMRK